MEKTDREETKVVHYAGDVYYRITPIHRDKNNGQYRGNTPPSNDAHDSQVGGPPTKEGKAHT